MHRLIEEGDDVLERILVPFACFAFAFASFVAGLSPSKKPRKNEAAQRRFLLR